MAMIENYVGIPCVAPKIKALKKGTPYAKGAIESSSLLEKSCESNRTIFGLVLKFFGVHLRSSSQFRTLMATTKTSKKRVPG